MNQWYLHIYIHIHYLFKQISSSSQVFPIIIVSGSLNLISSLSYYSTSSRVPCKRKKISWLCWNVQINYPNLDHFLAHLDLLGQVRTIFRLIDPTCSDCTVEADDIWTSRIGTLTKARRSILTTKTWEKKSKGGKQSRSGWGQFHMIGKMPVHGMYNSTIYDSIRYTIKMNQSILKYDYSTFVSACPYLFAWNRRYGPTLLKVKWSCSPVAGPFG